MAKHYGVEMRNVLTGFKWIGNQIANLEAAGQVDRFIFGFEESYGYLSSTFVRDKDAVIASMLLAEAAAWYKKRGMTLYEGLMELYEKYFQPTPEETAVVQPTLEGQMTDPIS